MVMSKFSQVGITYDHFVFPGKLEMRPVAAFKSGCWRQLSCKIRLWDKPLHGYCAEFDRATSVEETHADKSRESEVVREDDVDSSAGRGGRDSGRPLRP